MNEKDSRRTNPTLTNFGRDQIERIGRQKAEREGTQISPVWYHVWTVLGLISGGAYLVGVLLILVSIYFWFTWQLLVDGFALIVIGYVIHWLHNRVPGQEVFSSAV